MSANESTPTGDLVCVTPSMYSIQASHDQVLPSKNLSDCTLEQLSELCNAIDRRTVALQLEYRTVEKWLTRRIGERSNPSFVYGPTY